MAEEGVVELQQLGYKVLAHVACGVGDTLPGLLLERATKLHADRQMGGDATTPTGVLYIKCLGDCCKDRPLELHATGGCIYSGNAFEAHAGRQGRKKWRETIRVLPQNISVKAWLSSVGREYNRADSDNERAQQSPDAPGDSYVHAAVAAAAAAATAGGRELLGGTSGMARLLWRAGDQNSLAPLAALNGVPGAVVLGTGAAPSSLLHALLGQHMPPVAGGPTSPVMSGPALPPALASLLQQHAAHAAQQQAAMVEGPAGAAAATAAAAAAASRQRGEGAGESAALPDAAVLQALSALVGQLQHAQAGAQQEQHPPQQPPALAAVLAAAGEQQRGQQHGQLMEILITVVQQLAVQREQLQEQHAQLLAQGQQIAALTAQVASQAEQLAAARVTVQGISAARLRQAEQLSLQARQQQDLWGMVQNLQSAVQAINGAPLPKPAAAAGLAPDAHAAVEAPAAMLRVLSSEAAAQQVANHSAHSVGGAVTAAASGAGLQQLQAVLAAMAALTQQQQQPQQQHPQHQSQHPPQQPQPPSPPLQQLQQLPVPPSPGAPQQQKAAPAEGVAGSQPGSATAAGPAGGAPADGGAAAPGELATRGGSSNSDSPSRKRPRAGSHDS